MEHTNIPLLRSFIKKEMERYVEKVQEYHKSISKTHLRDAATPLEVPDTILEACVYINAYSQVMNFLDYQCPDVSNNMSNELAIRTAMGLFTEEMIKHPFDWQGAPKDEDGSTALVNSTWDQKDAPKGFASLLHFWYYHQRVKQTETV